jgi:hypothetical protein
MIGTFEALRHELVGPLAAHLGPVDEVREKLARSAATLVKVGAIVTAFGAMMIVVPLLK